VVYGYDESHIIIVPVPYDATSTYLRGADRGPAAILEASAALEFYDIETGTEVHTRGIHTLPPVNAGADPSELTEAVYRKVSGILGENQSCC